MDFNESDSAYLVEFANNQTEYSYVAQSILHYLFGKGFSIDLPDDDYLHEERNTQEINWLGNQIQIYPNPFIDKIILKNLYGVKLSKVQIYDLSNKLIFETKFDSIFEEYNCNTSQFTQGVYIIQLYFEDKKEFYKFIKM
jgi:hypothetical protein